MGGAQKKIRVQLDFDEQGFGELEALKADLRAGSRADTVRYGLGLLRWAVDQLKDGARILVEKDERLSGVVFPFLPTQQVKGASSPVTLRREDTVGEAVEAGRKAYQRIQDQVARFSAEAQDYETERGE